MNFEKRQSDEAGTLLSLISDRDEKHIKKGNQLIKPEVVEAKLNDEHERMRWDSYLEYFLSIIGFVIDLGNVWR